MQRHSMVKQIAFIAVLAFMCVKNIRAYDFKELDALLCSGRKEKTFPGAVVLLYHRGKIIYHKAHGQYTYEPSSKEISTHTRFDIASLTKIITTIAAMLVHDAGELSVEDPVTRYLPCFNKHDKKEIRIKHLLTHTSGLNDKVLVHAHTDEQFFKELCATPLSYKPGTSCSYSDINMVLLQKIIETITHQPFDFFVQQRITKPLHMHQTSFNPQETHNCAPTRIKAKNRPYLLQGEVDDDNAYRMNGVAGHAGLFSTAHDFAQCMLMLLHDGAYPCRLHKKSYFIKPQTIQEWSRVQADFSHICENGKRGYGLEIGRHLSPDAFGHFGWTGTSAWADKNEDLLCILFTNRVHPTYADSEKMKLFRKKFHDLVVNIIQKKS